MNASRPFPSLVVSPAGLFAQGSLATSLADVLEPDPGVVAEVNQVLSRQNIGIVAHYYMDPELQGVLAALPWPHIGLADSLAMAEKAVGMAQAGARAVLVLGVDFMAENVRATLDARGFRDVPVWRARREPMGCSLAEAAEKPEYEAWLRRASQTKQSLHLIYVNTSLRTKAMAQRLVPTLTCTSANVVATILQAEQQLAGLTLWYGPDTYMGQNLAELLGWLAGLGKTELDRLYPRFSRTDLGSLVERFHTFDKGCCIVHQLFGQEVAERVERDYPDALVTAHLEVPSAMFRLGLRAQQQGNGVVGSTSDILRFVGEATARASNVSEPLRVILGTETGLVTALVHRIRQVQSRAGSGAGAVELVFPVADGAIAATGSPELPVVPGVASGEGCSLEGGCANCPYMKQNSLGALLLLLRRLDEGRFDPEGYQVPSAGPAEAGFLPISHMRVFAQTGQLPEELVRDVLTRRA